MGEDRETLIMCGRSDRWVQCGDGITGVSTEPLLFCSGDGG